MGCPGRLRAQSIPEATGRAGRKGRLHVVWREESHSDVARHQVVTTYVNQLRLNPTALVGCPATPGMGKVKSTGFPPPPI